MRRKIMVVDDDVNLSRLLRHGIENKGSYDVVVENTSTLAAKRVVEIMPDLVVLDVVMPGMDGGDVQAEIRKDKRTKNIPIIFLTSMVTREESAANGGVIAGDKYLAKPVRIDELMSEIEASLKQA